MHDPLSNFRNALLERRRSILTQVATMSPCADRDAPGGGHENEGIQAIGVDNLDTLFRLDHVHRLELSRINEAIARIDSGCYGICSRCGTEIDRRLLQVLPYADTCTCCARTYDEIDPHVKR